MKRRSMDARSLKSAGLPLFIILFLLLFGFSAATANLAPSLSASFEVVLTLGALTLAWFLLFKYLGMFFLGTSGIFGLAIYLLALLFRSTPIFGFNLFTAVALSFLVSLPLMYLLLRTRGAYFAILSLGLNLAIPQIVSTIETSYFLVPARIILLSDPDRFGAFEAVSILFGVLVFVSIQLPKWKNVYFKIVATRDDETAAESLGINTLRYRFVGVSLTVLAFLATGAFHGAQLYRVDASTIFNAQYTLIPLVGGLIAAEFTRIPVIPPLVCLALPLAYIYFGILTPYYFETAVGLLIMGAVLSIYTLGLGRRVRGSKRTIRGG